MQHSTGSSAVSIALAAATSFFLACGSGSEDSPDGGVGPAGYITIESVTPDHGPLSGGNKVIVSGSGFLLAGAAQNNALLGGTLADRVSIINDTTVEVLVPAGTEAGSVGITLFNGNGSASLGDVYSYNSLPAITAISPAEGDYKGGDTVTLTGTGFVALEAGNNSVAFGGTDAVILDIAGDTSMTVVAPAGRPVTKVAVEVSNENGVGPAPDEYRYTTDGLLVFGHESGGGFAGVANPSDPEPGDIFHLDPITGVVESLESQITESDSRGASVCGGTAVQDDKIFVKATNNLFIQHDLESDSSERLDPLTGCSKIHALTSHQGQLFAICRDNQSQDFGSIDPVNRSFTSIGNFQTVGSRQNLASDGTRLLLAQDGTLSEINPNTGELTNSIDTGLSSIRGLAFADGVLYALQRTFGGKGPGGGPSLLFSISTETGATDFLFNIGTSLRGLAPIP